MLLSPYLAVSLCAATTLATSVLESSPRGDAEVKGPILLPGLLLPSNTSMSLSNVSIPSSNLLKIACDSSAFGKNLKIKSCRHLFGYVKKSDAQFTFAERDSGVPHDLPLPMRTYSNDGLCYVQPILEKGTTVGHASPSEVGQAAFTMLQACVVERGIGGEAYNIGGDDKVNVVIADYKPKVKCDVQATEAPEWLACVTIFTNMKASRKVQIFGASEDEAVEQELPLVLEAVKGNCQVVIDITGKDTLASWYEIWESVSAMASMCTRGKKCGGKAKGLGHDKNIFLELSTKKPHAGNQVTGLRRISFTNRDVDLQSFQALSSESESSDFQQGRDFDLVTQVPDRDRLPVTSAAEPSVNASQLAIE